MKNFDLVIINPGAQSHMFPGELGPRLSGKQPPYWAALLAGYIRLKGHRVTIIDAEVDDLSNQQVSDLVCEYDPHLVCISVLGSTPSASSTPKMTVAKELVKAINKTVPGTPIIWQGIHPSALPELTLRESGGDFVSRGEGFLNMAALLNKLIEKNENYDIPGICYIKEGLFFSNNSDEVVSTDELPMAAWDLLPIEKYKAHNWHCFDDIEKRQPYIAIYTAYGCPFTCHYCNIHELYSLSNKPLMRYRSISSIIDEIDWLVTNHNVKNFKFADELFTTNKKHVINVCDALIERNYDLNIWTFVRPDPYPIDLLKKMRSAGFTWVAMGIESFVDTVRNAVNKKWGQKKLAETIQRYNDCGINIIANFIFGLPDDTYETMNATLDMAMEYNFEYVDFYTCMAYPGSQLYLDSIKGGLEPNKTWHSYSQLGTETRPLPSKYLSSMEILKFRDEASSAYNDNFFCCDGILANILFMVLTVISPLIIVFRFFLI